MDSFNNAKLYAVNALAKLQNDVVQRLKGHFNGHTEERGLDEYCAACAIYLFYLREKTTIKDKAYALLLNGDDNE